jgi:lipopolysaccharide transport system ATP-binding protein
MARMIRVNAISKRYRLYHRPADRLLQWVLPSRRGPEHWALRDVTFDVAAGSSMGIVGPNGAGKSTLLKILTGTTQATSGDWTVEGRVASLLELGMGFHPEFTGRQNVTFGARMAGLDDAELDERFPTIVDFAELGSFIDQPVRTYSSGMLLRLGFALASSVEPDVLIVDEALAVGDLHFQQKCLTRIRRLHETGATILFVSHDPSLVKKFCHEAILLDQGRMIDRGKPDAVIDFYTAMLAERYREGGRGARTVRAGAEEPSGDGTERRAAGDDDVFLPPLEVRGHRTGNFRAAITGVWLEGGAAHGNSRIVTTGALARLHVRWVALEAVPSATVGIAIKDRLGQEIYGVNTAYRQIAIEQVAAGEAVETIFEMPINLGEGLYSVTAAVHAGHDHTENCYDWIEQALAVQVLPDPTEPFTGLCRLAPELRVARQAAGTAETARARAAAEAGATQP